MKTIPAKIENWLEEKLARRENRSGPVQIFMDEVCKWADDILDIFYGDEDFPPAKADIVTMIDKWLDRKGK